MDHCVLTVTCPNPRVAESIARALVDAGLAACGNVIGPVTSIYRWKGRLHRDSEVLLLLKTRRSLVRECTESIRAAHPYELPEILALPVVGGLPEYLAWVRAETRHPGASRRRPTRARGSARP
jgi:periplasmic divalent cation tolerance protein